ncbi:apolipoprotein D-like isoform X1 [Asterias amurensis]|uniref:apolipoprotein D-like isoform X1 n=1 Tax=Asterias amurensis TaxID=7602 RepID=UPI003AB1ECA6
MKSGAFVILGLVLAGLVACSQAEVFSWGRCPTVEVKNDFDLTALLGRWFQILRFKSSFAGGEGNRCMTQDYSARDDGKVKIVNSEIDESTGEPISVEGYAYAPNPEEPAKLKVDLTPGFEGEIWVLDTDYENFAMLHNCKDYYFFNLQLNWLHSRTRTLETGDVQDALKKFEDAGIDVSGFIKSDQTGCSE